MLKLRCDERFTHAFTAFDCVFKEITLVSSNQGNYFENATECSKRTLKTTAATQLYSTQHNKSLNSNDVANYSTLNSNHINCHIFQLNFFVNKKQNMFYLLDTRKMHNKKRKLLDL